MPDIGTPRCSAMSISKWCVGRSFFVGAALCGRPPPGHPHRGAPTAALALSGYDLSLSLSRRSRGTASKIVRNLREGCPVDPCVAVDVFNQALVHKEHL